MKLIVKISSFGETYNYPRVTQQPWTQSSTKSTRSVSLSTCLTTACPKCVTKLPIWHKHSSWEGQVFRTRTSHRRGMDIHAIWCQLRSGHGFIIRFSSVIDAVINSIHCCLTSAASLSVTRYLPVVFPSVLADHLQHNPSIFSDSLPPNLLRVSTFKSPTNRVFLYRLSIHMEQMYLPLWSL